MWVFPHRRILFSLKKEGNSDRSCKVNESWGHYAKPVTKGQTPYDPIFMRCLVKFTEMQRMVMAKGWGRRDGELVFDRYRVSPGEDENVLEMNGRLTQNLFEKGSHLHACYWFTWAVRILILNLRDRAMWPILSLSYSHRCRAGERAPCRVQVQQQGLGLLIEKCYHVERARAYNTTGR